MVNRGVMLCHVVAFIMWARHPIVPTLKLLDAIAQPVETHVHGFCSPRGNSIIDDAQCCRVVHLHRRRGMGVADFNLSMPGGNCFAAIDEESAELGVGGTLSSGPIPSLHGWCWSFLN